MPDRVIRDELLTSERYWKVSIEAQRFYIHLLLVADDMARVPGKNFTLRALCFPGQSVEPDRLESMLVELVDVDLVRLYIDGADRYIFIPRFRQRLRYQNSKLPTPPKEINDLTEKKSDYSQTTVRLQTDRSQTVVGRREEKRREVNPPDRLASIWFAEFWASYPRKVAKPAAQKAWNRLRSSAELVSEIMKSLERQKQSDQWRRGGGQFIPHPATWLNGRRWEDSGEGVIAKQEMPWDGAINPIKP